MVAWKSVAKSRLVIALAALAIVILLVRLALPKIVLDYVNSTLDRLESYSGEVADIDIHLIRGAYVIKGLKIQKTGGKVPVPFIEADRIDLSMQWSEIINGAIVGEIQVQHPQINFVKGPSKETSQSGLGQSWIELTGDLFPFRLNHVELNNAEIHYRDFHTAPKVDIYLDKIYAKAENLTNSRSVSNEKFAGLVIYNKPGENDPSIDIRAQMDSFAEAPAFELVFSVKNLRLAKLNEFFRAYGKFDVESGTFSMYSEIESAKGSYDGYVKPLFKDMKVIGPKDKDQNMLSKLWESIVGAAAKLLESEETERVATVIPIKGNFENKDIDVWAAIANLLRNAFIQAIRPGFEGITDRGLPGMPADEKNKDQ